MSDIVSLLPLVFVFVVFYAVLYLPQRRRNKKHKEFVENLKIGEDVITDSGIYGRVTSISDDTVTLVLKNGEIKIKTSFINSISCDEPLNFFFYLSLLLVYLYMFINHPYHQNLD